MDMVSGPKVPRMASKTSLQGVINSFDVAIEKLLSSLSLINVEYSEMSGAQPSRQVQRSETLNEINNILNGL